MTAGGARTIVRLNFVVEGQTEEAFVHDLLLEPLAEHGVVGAVQCVTTSRKGGQVHRGGMTTYAKVKRDLGLWLTEDRTAYLTTMFDLYRLPGDFPGHAAALALPTTQQKVQALELALGADVGDPRFRPHIQPHEFEALLFSDVVAADEALLSLGVQSRLGELRTIRHAFDSPEDINQGPETAPSRRLIGLYPGYDKLAFGLTVARRVGLTAMRAACPHFNAWLSGLEAL